MLNDKDRMIIRDLKFELSKTNKLLEKIVERMHYK